MTVGRDTPWPPDLVRGYRHVCTYDYCDEEGRLVQQRGRFEAINPRTARGKTFRPRWPQSDDFQYNKQPEGVRKVVYRLPDLRERLDSESCEGDVWWCEGERDVDAAWRIGLAATTLGSATAGIPDDLATQLRGCVRLFLVPDNDAAGRKGAERIAAELHPAISDIRIVELPGVPEDGGDLSDFLAQGGSREDLERIAEAAYSWQPSESNDKSASASNAKGADSSRTSARPPAIADEFVRYALELEEAGSLELFHDPDGEAFATLKPPVFPFVETVSVKQRTFSLRLKGRLLVDRLMPAGRVRSISSAAWADVLGTLEALACHNGKRHDLFYRVARLDKKIIIDLGESTTGRAVVAEPSGWDVVADPPVRFRRGSTMRPLPAEPARGGDPALFRSYVSLAEDDYPLLFAWLVAACGKPPYPILHIGGEQDSGKSFTAKICRKLIDPAKPELRAMPRDERDLAIAARHSHVLGFDNLSGLSGPMSDALCRLAYGEGFGTRALHTDDQEVVFYGARPIVLNGIEQAAGKPDLLRRSFLVESLPIPDDRKRDDEELWEAFAHDHARLFGVLLDGLVLALRDEHSVRLERRTRMPHIARAAVAAETAFGLDPGKTELALERAGEAAQAAALDSSPFALAVLAFVERQSDSTWKGAAGALRGLLDERRPENEKPPRGWPTSPEAVAKALTRDAPALRSAGYEVKKLPREGRLRMWSIAPVQR